MVEAKVLQAGAAPSVRPADLGLEVLQHHLSRSLVLPIMGALPILGATMRSAKFTGLTTLKQAFIGFSGHKRIATPTFQHDSSHGRSNQWKKFRDSRNLESGSTLSSGRVAIKIPAANSDDGP